VPSAKAVDGGQIPFERHDPSGGDRGRVLVALAAMGATARLYTGGIERGLRAGYSVVIVEHRVGDGLGRPPWRTSAAAADVVAVLEEIGVQRAHVSGASLGAMIAQEVAIRHPERTAALVLAATTGGWPRLDLHPPLGVLALTRATIRPSGRELALDARVARAMPVWFSKEFAARATPGSPAWETLASILKDGAPSETRRAQLLAAMRHSTWSRLPRIAAPTLVQHGAQDRVISPRAGRKLARRIPDARFHLWADAGHALGIEIPDESYGLALRFLAQHDHLLEVGTGVRGSVREPVAGARRT
jgi:pimeloyl-ACP methyl ester carboxylesterase